ncbi:MAG: HlyD family type I secretion periplasmic adaptor subunit, partial [Pseudomonadota bacterium]
MMFGQDVSELYANAPHASGTGRRGTWRALAVIVLGMAAFFLWAARFEIEEVTRGAGQVEPSSNTMTIQTVDGGVLVEVAVAEGDAVEAGDLLVIIDDTRVGARQGELRRREDALLAERARMRAVADGLDAPSFEPDLETRAPGAVAAEHAVFISRRAQLETELGVLRGQLIQREAAMAEATAQVERLRTVLRPLNEELDLTEDLARRGAIPQIELLRLRGRVAETGGQLTVARASLPRIEAEIAETQAQIDAAQSAVKLGATERLARIQVELSVLREELRGADDLVARTELRAPRAGLVNQLTSTSPGAVFTPGTIVAEIVPLDEDLLIEAHVQPSDVAFIETGDPVQVKVTAYDYLLYGTLSGRVERVGASTVEGPDGTPVFKVIVAADRNYLGPETAPLPVSAGMAAVVE